MSNRRGSSRMCFLTLRNNSTLSLGIYSSLGFPGSLGAGGSSRSTSGRRSPIFSRVDNGIEWRRLRSRGVLLLLLIVACNHSSKVGARPPIFLNILRLHALNSRLDISSLLVLPDSFQKFGRHGKLNCMDDARVCTSPSSPAASSCEPPRD